MRLSRFNELTAILAAGTSLLRVALPIVIAGIMLNLFLLADQEWLIPQIIPMLIRSHEEMHTQTPKTYMVQMMQDDRDGLFNAALYTPPGTDTPASIQYLDVVERMARTYTVGLQRPTRRLGRRQKRMASHQRPARESAPPR